MTGIALHESLALASTICGAVALGGLLPLAVREARNIFRRETPVATPPAAPEAANTSVDPTPRTYLSATLGRFGVQLQSERPIELSDLEAARIMLVRQYGPVIGTALAFELYEQLIATATDDIDSELQALTGGAA